MDLKNLSLPDKQDALIEAVAAANPHTIVVLETGGAVLMPWLDKVAAVVETWYPGIRGSEAIANVLFGDINPSGKLPITFPKSEADLPHPIHADPPKPDATHVVPKLPGAPGLIGMAMGIAPSFDVNYDEGLKVGYKWYDAEKKPVLFPFGFGLSYTTYAYSGLKVTPGDPTEVSFTIKNTGKRRRERDRPGLRLTARLRRRTTKPSRRLVQSRPRPRRIEAGLRPHQPRTPSGLRRALRLLEAGTRPIHPPRRRLLPRPAASTVHHLLDLH